MKKPFASVLLDYIERENLEDLEGERGVANLTNIVKAIGYKDLTTFLAANPGAVSTLHDWIQMSNNEEWLKHLQHLMDPEDG